MAGSEAERWNELRRSQIASLNGDYESFGEWMSAATAVLFGVFVLIVVPIVLLPFWLPYRAHAAWRDFRYRQYQKRVGLHCFGLPDPETEVPD